MKDKQWKLKPEDIIFIDGCRVYWDGQDPQTELSEGIIKSGFMSVDTATLLTLAGVRFIYDMKPDALR